MPQTICYLGFWRECPNGSRERRANSLSFAARCLEFLVPSPRVTRTIAEAVWLETVRWANGHVKAKPADREMFRLRESKGLIGDLLGATRENRDPIRAFVVQTVVDAITGGSASDADLAAGTVLDLELFGLMRGYPLSTESQQFGRAIAAEAIDSTREEFEARAQADRSVAFDLMMRGRLEFGQYLEWHRFSTIFLTRSSFVTGGWPSIAQYLMAVWVHDPAHISAAERTGRSSSHSAGKFSLNQHRGLAPASFALRCAISFGGATITCSRLRTHRRLMRRSLLLACLPQVWR